MGSKIGGGGGGGFSLGYGTSPFSTPTRQGQCVMSSQMHTVDSRGYSSGGFNTGGLSSYFGSHGSSVYTGSSGHPSLDSGADSDASMHTDSEDNYPLVSFFSFSCTWKCTISYWQNWFMKNLYYFF